MAGLAELVRQEVEKYAAPSYNSRSYAVLDDQRQIYVAMSVNDSTDPDRAIPIVMARIEGDKVIIEADNTNKPLADALEQVGIATNQIVLAYNGETIPNLHDNPN